MPHNPRVDTPDVDPELHPNTNPSGSLVEQLGDVVDDMRQLYTDFGYRPYRVFSVLVGWSGGNIGLGEQRVLGEQEFLPTPLFDVAKLPAEVKSGGRVENGQPRLTGLSPRYTEDDINQLCHRGPMKPGQEGFIEVRIDSRDGLTKRRRFCVSGAPLRRTNRMDWSVDLTSAYPDRTRAGKLT